jgi:hypothetical protein
MGLWLGAALVTLGYHSYVRYESMLRTWGMRRQPCERRCLVRSMAGLLGALATVEAFEDGFAKAMTTFQLSPTSNKASAAQSMLRCVPMPVVSEVTGKRRVILCESIARIHNLESAPFRIAAAPAVGMVASAPRR